MSFEGRKLNKKWYESQEAMENKINETKKYISTQQQEIQITTMSLIFSEVIWDEEIYQGKRKRGKLQQHESIVVTNTSFILQVSCLVKYKQKERSRSRKRGAEGGGGGDGP